MLSSIINHSKTLKPKKKDKKPKGDKNGNVYKDPLAYEQYLLDEEQLEANTYPDHFPRTKGREGVPVVAIDCEMVRTEVGSEIARVTVVGIDKEILLDEFVIPEFPVEDYLTEFSGVTESLIE